MCGDAVSPDPSPEPATPREHLYARSLVWTEPGGPRHRCLRAVAWVPGVAGVGPPSPPPVQPQRGVVCLTGLDANELPPKGHYRKRPFPAIMAQGLRVPSEPLMLSPTHHYSRKQWKAEGLKQWQSSSRCRSSSQIRLNYTATAHEWGESETGCAGPRRARIVRARAPQGR